MSTKDSNPKDAIGDTKLPLALLSPIAKAYWALGQFVGMLKYGSWNWRVAGVRTSVYLHAAGRHLDAYASGEECDPVDGTHHLGNVMACCAIILDARAAGKLTDDRPPSVGVRPTYAEQEALMAKLKVQYEDKKPRHYTIADTEYRQAEDYCAVCEHDFCQCSQSSVEKGHPVVTAADCAAMMAFARSSADHTWPPKAGDWVRVLYGSRIKEVGWIGSYIDGLFQVVFTDEESLRYYLHELAPVAAPPSCGAV